jgi:branched-chain amino acid transport system substrate-binding protein
MLGLTAAGLSACVADPAASRYAAPVALNKATRPDGAALPRGAGRRVAILLPLTGPNAEVGQALLKAAQLALDQPGSPELNQQDTGGTPDGAVKAARAALAAGAGIILGPLTAAETAAAAPVARAAGAPMLAFTSDSNLAQPGVWTLGLAPGQQVRRLVLALQAENKTRLAAVVPENPFGEALAAGMLTTAGAVGMPMPRVVRTPSSFTGMNDALKSVSDYGSRRGAMEAQQRSARASNDADGRRNAAEIGRRQPSPPPMDALLLGASGALLGQAAPLLSFYDIGPDQVRILGPATWAREASRLPALSGAWYAAPDPAAKAGFEQLYAKKFNAPPRDFTTLAYDAAGIARAIAAADGFPVGSLTRAEGFAGSDGLVALLPDGQVRRGLAIFEIDRAGSHIVQPAPTTLAAPGV